MGDNLIDVNCDQLIKLPINNFIFQLKLMQHLYAEITFKVDSIIIIDE